MPWLDPQGQAPDLAGRSAPARRGGGRHGELTYACVWGRDAGGGSGEAKMSSNPETGVASPASVPGARTAEEALDEWAREQDTKPYLRFSTADSRGSIPVKTQKQLATPMQLSP